MSDPQKKINADPNLALFNEDEYRYKAFRWWCARDTILKVSAIVSGSLATLSLIIRGLVVIFN